MKEYHNMNFDISKYIRASIKYKLDNRYFELSDVQLNLARKMNKIRKEVERITFTINHIAFEKGGYNFYDKEIMNETAIEFNDIIEEVHDTVLKLQSASAIIS